MIGALNYTNHSVHTIKKPASFQSSSVRDSIRLFLRGPCPPTAHIQPDGPAVRPYTNAKFYHAFEIEIASIPSSRPSPLRVKNLLKGGYRLAQYALSLLLCFGLLGKYGLFGGGEGGVSGGGVRCVEELTEDISLHRKHAKPGEGVQMDAVVLTADQKEKPGGASVWCTERHALN